MSGLCGAADVINSFSGTHRFLSNFFIEPDGTCVELEFQRAKCAIKEDRKLFAGLTPGQAKRLGRTVRLRDDWEAVKILLMQHYVERKFSQHPGLMQQLRATAPAVLIEGNNWGDCFWGRVNGEGENWLGRILSSIRDGHPLV